MHKILFIIDCDPNTCIDQILMFVPFDFDRKRVSKIARECGIPNPNIFREVNVVIDDAMMDQIDYYRVYSS